MPELPEVESIRRGIVTHGVGHAVTNVIVSPDQVTASRTLRVQPGGATELIGRITGKTLEAAVRRGKFLWLLLSDDEAILIHLGMSGQVLFLPSTAASPRNTRVRCALDNDVDLLFVDQRSFGYFSVTDLVPTRDGLPAGVGSALGRLPQRVGHIGRDVLDPHLDRDLLVRQVRHKNSQIKRILLDQHVASGIGNIYADEALWRARVRYDRIAGSLRAATVSRIYDAATEVMSEALAAGGTSFDALYVNVNGESGYFDRSLNVYGLAGHPCKRCGTLVVRESFMNRSSYFCPVCQRKR